MEAYEIQRGSPTRRQFLRAVGLGGAATVMAGCAPAAPDPSAPDGLTGVDGPGSWEQEWQQLIAAAKQEGKLAITTRTGVGFRNAVQAFNDAFPEIEIEHRQFSAIGQFVPVLFQERQAGIYTWDVSEGSSTIFLPQVRPEGGIAPFRPLLMRPDVTGDEYWNDGFDSGWLDKEKQFGYAYAAVLGGFWWINTDLVKEGELKSIDDLLNPKWKGKILMQDVRQGATFGIMDGLKMKRGIETVRRLLIDQNPAFNRDSRFITEAVVRANYPIVAGLSDQILEEFRAQGVGKNVKPVDIPETTYVTESNALWLLDRAPHPKAARLFLNWVLTQEGQEVWCRNVEVNSRRKGIKPVAPELQPVPGRQYRRSGPEEHHARIDETQKQLVEIARERGL